MSDNGNGKIVGYTPRQDTDEEIQAIKAKQQAEFLAGEAERLAGLEPPVRELLIDTDAERLGTTPARLRAAVREIVREKEKAAAAAEAEQRRLEKERAAAEREQQRIAERKLKEKQKGFTRLAELPRAQRETGLANLAESLSESIDGLTVEFMATMGITETDVIVPWAEPVETGALLDELEAQLRKFVIFTSGEDVMAVALWIMLAWIHDIAAHSPMLFVTSADGDCGKSTLLNTIAKLVPKPQLSVDMTTAALYRAIDSGPTLVLDEIQQLLRRKDVASIINGGWTPGQTVSRTIGGVPCEFSIFGPKALAGVKDIVLRSMARTTAGRCITIELWPKMPDEKVEDLALADEDAFETLRRKLLRWSADNAASLKDARPTPPPGFNNRLRMNWSLQLAIADLAGAAHGERARRAAVKLSNARDETSVLQLLLAALREMFAAHGDVLTSAQVVDHLNADPTGDWCEYGGRGRPITQRQVAVVLKAVRIRPDVVHPTGRSDDSPRGYKVEWFEDAFARFLPPMRTSAHQAQSQGAKPKREASRKGAKPRRKK